MRIPRILISAPAPNHPAANYVAAIAAAGAESRVIYCPPVDTDFDGLLLTGGGDLDPALFRQPNRGSNPPDPNRDRAELPLVHAYLSAGKPVFGICRGCQVLNVALGGTLIQDLASLNTVHTSGTGDVTHTVTTAPGSLLHQLFSPRFRVNSAHHQAIDLAGHGLAVTARDAFGVIEAVELPGRPVLGVQFHPERMTGPLLRSDCPDGTPLFRWFVAQCRRQNLSCNLPPGVYNREKPSGRSFYVHAQPCSNHY